MLAIHLDGAFLTTRACLPQHTRPTSITMAIFTGADRKLRVDFEPGSNSVSFIGQALKAVRLRSPIQFFGKATGLIINYSPDNAVRFDLDGRPQEILPAAFRGGTLTVSLGGRPVDRDTLAAIFTWTR